MSDQPTDSPRLADCTTVTLITPSRWRLATVRVALVRTDRMADLVNDFRHDGAGGDTESALVWASGDNGLVAVYRCTSHDRLDDLAALIDRYDERLDTGQHEPRRAPEGQS